MPRTQGQGVRGHGGSRADADGRRPKGRDAGQNRRKSVAGGGNSGGAGGAPVKSSHIIEEHIDVGVPRQMVYDQWTQYQDLAKYSKKESAEAKRKDRVGFTSKIGPSSRTWEAQIVEQDPGRRIAWRSIGGAQHMGVVTFHQFADDRLTRVMVEMEYDPSGFVETIGNFFRMQRRRVRKNLKLFKHFIELRGEATGKGAEAVHSGDGLRQETDERLGRDESPAAGEGSSSDEANTSRKAS